MSRPEEVLLRVYGRSSLAEIAARWGVTAEDPLPELEQLWGEKKARKQIVDELPEDQRGFLAFMDKIGRRLRGERLKKRWFLHGYADFEERLMPLVDRGLVVVGNVSAREAVSLDTALEQGLLQQWLQVTPGFEGLGGKPPEPRKVVESVEDETRLERSRRLVVVEFNVLNAVRFVERNRVRLNRDGSPHRSDLKAMAPFLIDLYGASEPGTVAPDPLHVDGWDVHIAVLSLAEALGMLVRRGDVLETVGDGSSYFLKPFEERLHLLHRALEQQRAWSELEAAAWHATGEPPQTGQGHGAFTAPDERSASLAGPRGSVLSALRRLQPRDWFDVDETIRTIASLEQQYLSTSLPVSISGEPLLEDFVRGVITYALSNVAGIELGRSTSGSARARLTDVGRALLGISPAPDEVDGKGSIVVEPNFEITCFLDMAPARLLYDLSRFTELVDTSERVVRYRLTGEAVQWGYARGYTAATIEEILRAYTHQSIPPAVTFALEDWERIHRRVTVYLNGELVAAAGKTDPEVVQSGVIFAVQRDDEYEVVNDTFTFVNSGYEDDVNRALRAHKPVIIDYDGPIHPSLVWIDDQRLQAPRGGTDLRILARLAPLTVREDDDLLRIDPDLIRKRFPEDGLDRLITTLRTAVAGGLAAEREFSLKKLLGRPADGRIESMEVLVVTSDEDGDRIHRVAALREFISERLGQRAFRVVPGRTAEFEERLAALGIRVRSS